MGQGIGFPILGLRDIGNAEVKPGEEEAPPDQVLIEASGCLQVFQIPVVSQNVDRVMGPFKVMPPDIESSFDAQEFPLPDGVVVV